MFYRLQARRAPRQSAGYDGVYAIREMLPAVFAGNIRDGNRGGENKLHRHRLDAPRFLENIVAARNGYRYDDGVGLGRQLESPGFERKHALPPAPVTFWKNDHRAAFLDVFYTLIDDIQRFFDVFSIQKKTAQQSDPHIDARQPYKLFLCHKAEWSARIGKDKQDVKDASVVAYKAYAALLRNMLPSLDRQLATGNNNKQLRPYLRYFIHGKRYIFLKTYQPEKEQYRSRRRQDDNRCYYHRKNAYCP
jgi:hypothetical protein